MADSIRGTVIANGLALPNVLVRIYLAGTGTLASLYSDEALTTPVVNDGVTGPLSESDGSFGPFFAVNGRYDVKYVKTGYSFNDADTANLLLFDEAFVTETAINLSLTRNHSQVWVTATAQITLPAAATFTAAENKRFTIINSSAAGTVTIVLAGGDSMTPNSVLMLSSQQWLELESNGVTAWRIVRSSIGSVATRPSFQARKSAPQTFALITYTKATFDVEDADPTAAFASSKFTPLIGGYYELSALLHLKSAVSLGGYKVAIYKNGALLTETTADVSWYSYGTNEKLAGFLSYLVLANGSTDYFEVYVYSGGADTLSIEASDTIFNGKKVD